MNRAEIETAKQNGTLDERCTCGHLKSHHFPRVVEQERVGQEVGYIELADGHGRCRHHRTCGCKQFTWAEFVVIKEEVTA